MKTVSDEEGRIEPAEWEAMLNTRPYIILFSEDWSILRYGVLKNCLTMKCKQAVGAFDNLFYTLDGALKKIPFHP